MKRFISIFLIAQALILALPAYAQADFPIFPIDFGTEQFERLTDRTPVIGYRFSAKPGDKVAINASSTYNSTLLYLEVQLLDALDWTVIGSDQTISAADPATIMSEIQHVGYYVIRLSKGDSLGGGEFSVNLQLLPSDAEIIQSSAHGMGKTITGPGLVRGDINRCHNDYSPVPRDTAWGIVWYRNSETRTFSGMPDIRVPGAGDGFLDTEYSPRLATMPGGVDFFFVPSQLLFAESRSSFNRVVSIRNLSDWNSDDQPYFKFYSARYLSSPSIVGGMDLEIELTRHYTENGQAPFFHHSIEFSVTNTGDYNIPSDVGRIAFAVYNTAGELVDMGGYYFEGKPFEVGTTRTINLHSLSKSGSCVQPYDPQGHEIWVGIYYGGNPDVVFNAHRVFPVGTVPFEIAEHLVSTPSTN